MPNRSMIGAVTAAAVMAAATGALASDDAKYPDWKGIWTRARVPGAVGQPPHDPSKPPGRGQEAPLTPEYQAKFEANLADQANGGQGTSATFTCLPNGHAAHDDGLRADRIHHHAGHHLCADRPHRAQPPHLYRRPRLARGRSSRAGSDTPSANGSTRTATAATTRSRSRAAASRARAPTTPAACRCTRTTRASSRSASVSTRPTATSCTTRSPPSTTR